MKKKTNNKVVNMLRTQELQSCITHKHTHTCVAGNISLPAVDCHLAPPYNLDARPLKPDAIALSWMYSAKGLSAAKPVTHYTVRCETLESPVLGGSCQGVASQSVILKTRSAKRLFFFRLRQPMPSCRLGEVGNSSILKATGAAWHG